MKKIFLAVLVVVSACAEPFGYMTAKVLPTENRGYCVFSDGSFWRVTTFVKRWRSPLEWVSGTELYVPDEYVCDLKDFSLGDVFEAYEKYGNARVDESAASNQDELKKCSHLLVNPRTGKIFYATPLHPVDFTYDLFSEGRSIGYSEGYTAGYSSGYDWGYSSGKASVEPLNN